MLDWWTDLPPLLRLGVALVLIVLGVIFFFAGTRGWTLAIVGIVLLFFCGPSDSEKKGYNF
jgi:hypothetical protein